MNTWEADALAEKLAHSWPRSAVSAHSWAEELLELDKGRAEAAVRQLVRTAEHAPAIATFLAAYRNLASTAHPEFECRHCANSGWVTDTNHPAHWPGKHPQPDEIDESGRTIRHPGDIPKIPDYYTRDDGCLCNVSRPCSCEHGKRVEQNWKKP